MAMAVASAPLAGKLSSSSSFNSSSLALEASSNLLRVFAGNGRGFSSLCLRQARNKSMQCSVRFSARHGGHMGQQSLGAGRREFLAERWRFLAAHDEAAFVDVDKAAGVEVEVQSEGKREAWSQAVDSLAEEVQKLKGVLYEESADRALGVLREITDQLREQADKARTSLILEESAGKAMATLRDTTEQLREQAGKAKAALAASAQEAADNLALIAEQAPEPIRDIAGTARDAHFVDPGKTENWAKIHDFCLGIPYGALLTAGGLFWFIASGSVSALRFGLFLGGLVLFLSVRSLKTWRLGKSSLPYIQGQALITFIIFVREARRFSATSVVFPTAVVAVASAAMLGFYAYVYLAGGNPPPKSLENEAASA